jgi:hypothetical protein
VNAARRERIQVDWHCCHEGLPFAGRHFGDPPLVQHHATDKLNVERYHVPHRRMTEHIERPSPVLHALAGVLHRCKRLREQLFQDFGRDFIALFLQTSDLVQDALALRPLKGIRELLPESCNLLFRFVDCLTDATAEFLCLATELFVESS